MDKVFNWNDHFDRFLHQATSGHPDEVHPMEVKAMKHAFVAGWACMKMAIMAMSKFPPDTQQLIQQHMTNEMHKYYEDIGEDQQIKDLFSEDSDVLEDL